MDLSILKKYVVTYKTDTIQYVCDHHFNEIYIHQTPIVILRSSLFLSHVRKEMLYIEVINW